MDYERPPQGLVEFVVTFVEDVPSYCEAGDASHRAIPIYSCNLVNYFSGRLRAIETAIRFRIAGDAF